MNEQESQPAPPGRLVIGARGSALAVAQAEWVAAGVRRHYPGLEVAIKTFRTRGDRGERGDRPTAAVGGKGLFTAELEAALASGAIDLAVHSAKDLPTALAAGTEVLAWPPREDARDALIVGSHALADASLASIPVGATVGTGSLRRAGQLKSLRSDLNVQPIRGNIETRIRKVRQGQFAATLLAVAGLRRAGLLGPPMAIDGDWGPRSPNAKHRVWSLGPLADAAGVLSIEQMTPAAGQGALALHGRADDRRVGEIVSALDDAPTRRAVLGEREVVSRLAGGCNMPLGVYFEDRSGRLRGRAILVAPGGRPRIEASAEGTQPADLAEALVEQLLSRGGAELLKQAR